MISARRRPTSTSEEMLLDARHVAKNMKVQVSSTRRGCAYRLLGYEDRAVADSDFRDDKVDAGEVGAGHRVTALYELVLAGQAIPTPTGAPDVLQGPPVTDLPPDVPVAADDVVRVSVRYQAIGEAATRPRTRWPSACRPPRWARTWRRRTPTCAGPPRWRRSRRS